MMMFRLPMTGAAGQSIGSKQATTARCLLPYLLLLLASRLCLSSDTRQGGSSEQPTVTLGKEQVRPGERLPAFCQFPRAEMLQWIGETVLYQFTQDYANGRWKAGLSETTVGTSPFQELIPPKYELCSGGGQQSENKECRVNVQCFVFFKDSSGSVHSVRSPGAAENASFYFVTPQKSSRQLSPNQILYKKRDCTQGQGIVGKTLLLAGDSTVLFCSPPKINMRLSAVKLARKPVYVRYSWKVEWRSMKSNASFQPYRTELPDEQLVQLRTHNAANCSEPYILQVTCLQQIILSKRRRRHESNYSQSRIAVMCNSGVNLMPTPSSEPVASAILPESKTYDLTEGAKLEVCCCVSTNQSSSYWTKKSHTGGFSPLFPWRVNRQTKALQISGIDDQAGEYTCHAGGQTSTITVRVNALHQRQPQLQSVHPLLVRHTHSGFADYLVLVCLASSPASLSIPQLSLLAKNKTNSELWKAEVHDVELQKYTFCHAAERLNVLGMVLPADQGNETSLGVLAGREPPKMAPLEGAERSRLTLLTIQFTSSSCEAWSGQIKQIVVNASGQSITCQDTLLGDSPCLQHVTSPLAAVPACHWTTLVQHSCDVPDLAHTLSSSIQRRWNQTEGEPAQDALAEHFQLLPLYPRPVAQPLCLQAN